MSVAQTHRVWDVQYQDVFSGGLWMPVRETTECQCDGVEWSGYIVHYTYRTETFGVECIGAPLLSCVVLRRAPYRPLSCGVHARPQNAPLPARHDII